MIGTQRPEFDWVVYTNQVGGCVAIRNVSDVHSQRTEDSYGYADGNTRE